VRRSASEMAIGGGQAPGRAPCKHGGGEGGIGARTLADKYYARPETRVPWGEAHKDAMRACLFKASTARSCRPAISQSRSWLGPGPGGWRVMGNGAGGT